MPSSVSMRRVTKLRSGEQMISLAAVIFMVDFLFQNFNLFDQIRATGI
jgi:hypothetical protein